MGEALACLLECRRGWLACFVARSVREAIDAPSESAAAILLVDVAGLAPAERAALIALREEGGPMVALLVSEDDLEPHLDLPVDRVLSRQASPETLLAALDEMSRPIGRPRTAPMPFDLSRREMECVQLVARGMSNRRISELMGLREQSVKNVVSLAMRKLSVANRVQIALRLSGSAAKDWPTPSAASLPGAAPGGVEA